MGSNKLIVGTNDLKSWCIKNNKTKILDDWDYSKNGDLTPETIAYASNKRVWWKCAQGHSFDAKVNNRVVHGTGCPYCAGSKTLEGYNDFKTWCQTNGREGTRAMSGMVLPCSH